MFVEFRKTLLKMGKFKISVGCRMKGVSAIIFLCIRGILYLYLYMFVAMGWIAYGVCWIYYKLFSCLFKLIKMLFIKIKNSVISRRDAQNIHMNDISNRR